jgi:hypothetical protein
MHNPVHKMCLIEPKEWLELLLIQSHAFLHYFANKSTGNSSLEKRSSYLTSLAKDYVPTEDQAREMATVQKILIPDKCKLVSLTCLCNW